MFNHMKYFIHKFDGTFVLIKPEIQKVSRGIIFFVCLKTPLEKSENKFNLLFILLHELIN